LKFLIGFIYRVPVTIFGDSNLLDPYPVRNDLGASVGRVIGDGIYFETLVNPQPVIWDEEVTGGL
jgi:hypothetical protein